jgi:hypothetical protein
VCKGKEKYQFIENIRIMLRALLVEGNDLFTNKIFK